MDQGSYCLTNKYQISIKTLFIKDLKTFIMNLKLEKIKSKYESLEYNRGNFSIGGGLASDKFASNRHEDAKNDDGKLTLGKVAQVFKKATGASTQEIKSIILDNFHLEWHHAGKLPKSYGGGMKKTYFLNSEQIVKLASNWDSYYQSLKKHEESKIKRTAFLKKYANEVERVGVKPKNFVKTKTEMYGKYGWFEANEYYNLPMYYSGWVFRSKRKLNEFESLK